MNGIRHEQNTKEENANSKLKRIRFIEVSGSCWFIQHYSVSLSNAHKNTLALVINNSWEKKKQNKKKDWKKKAFLSQAFVVCAEPSAVVCLLCMVIYFFLLHHLNVIISFTKRVCLLAKKRFLVCAGTWTRWFEEWSMRIRFKRRTVRF